MLVRGTGPQFSWQQLPLPRTMASISEAAELGMLGQCSCSHTTPQQCSVSKREAALLVFKRRKHRCISPPRRNQESTFCRHSSKGLLMTENGNKPFDSCLMLKDRMVFYFRTQFPSLSLHCVCHSTPSTLNSRMLAQCSQSCTNTRKP